MGEFVDLLTELAETDDFKTVVVLPRSKQLDGTAQDYVLRFFAFHDEYKSFEHSVRDFLTDYCAKAAKAPDLDSRRKLFATTFEVLAKTFPDGLKSRKGTTPVNLFEGVAVGAALALDTQPSLGGPGSMAWLSSASLKKFTTGATNNRSRVSGRIEFCRDRFLAGK